MIELLPEPVLCYVQGFFAYFTNLPLAHQWGDDWDDAPYEYNAGRPYEWREYMTERGIPQYEITVVGWYGDFQTPDANFTNSPYSVDRINRGNVPWLAISRYATNENARPIFAGVTIREFKRLIWQADGDIYERVEPEIEEPHESSKHE